MKPTQHAKWFWSGASALLMSVALAPLASAADSDYATITETGSASDFTGVSDAYSDPTATGDMPITSIQIANDGTNLYVGIMYASAINPDALADGGQETIALDNDNNLSTGYNTFGANAVGSDIAFAYDYPFQQTSTDYNTGVEGITEYGGDFASTTNYTPYDASTTFEEFSISLADTYTANGTTYAVFPDSTFALAFYDGNSDADNFTGAIDYTLATAATPEPNTLALLFGGMGVLALLLRRRFQALV